MSVIAYQVLVLFFSNREIVYLRLNCDSATTLLTSFCCALFQSDGSRVGQATRRLCCSVIAMIRPRCLCHLKRRCLRVASVEDQLSFTLLRVNLHVVAEAHLIGRAIQNKFRTSP